MIDLSKIKAIDIHTHAEEPCGTHGDDGYDEFLAGMAKYFKADYTHPPTIEETADYFRARQIACVIFGVDSERETGFRRYSNFEIAEAAHKNSDIMIPFASIDPAKGKTGAREARSLDGRVEMTLAPGVSVALKRSAVSRVAARRPMRASTDSIACGSGSP